MRRLLRFVAEKVSRSIRLLRYQRAKQRWYREKPDRARLLRDAQRLNNKVDLQALDKNMEIMTRRHAKNEPPPEDFGL